MAINTALVAEKIFNELRGKGFLVKSFSKTGDLVTNPQEATRFAVAEPNILVRLDLNKESIGLSVSKDYDDDELRTKLKELAQDSLLSFDFRVFNKKIEPKGEKIDIAKKAERNMADVIGEASLGRMTGSSKTSYQPLESVKVVVRHKKAVNEEIRGARSRNIHSIFVQRGDERFKMAENNLQMARAMARHLYNGGEVHDKIGEAISTMAVDYRQLREFVSYVQRNKVINEDNQDIFELAVDRVKEIRETFKRLTGAKSYVIAVESLSEDNWFTQQVDKVNTAIDTGKTAATQIAVDQGLEMIDSKEEITALLSQQGLNGVKIDPAKAKQVTDAMLQVGLDKVKADPMGFAKHLYQTQPKLAIGLGAGMGLAAVGAGVLISKTGKALANMLRRGDKRNQKFRNNAISDSIGDRFTESHLDDKVINVINTLENLRSRRTQFEESIMTAIESETFAGVKDLLKEDDVVDFASPEARLGYQVSQMGYSATNSTLSNYLQNIGNKISNGGNLNPFEYRAVKASLLSAGQKDSHATPTDVSEQYESFLNQFVD